MNKTRHLDISLSDVLALTPTTTGKFSGGGIMLLRDTESIRLQIQCGQPYRLREPRLIRVTGGIALYNINLLDYKLAKGDVLFLPRQSVVEISRYSPDFGIDIIIIESLPFQEATLTIPSEILLASGNQENNISISYIFDCLVSLLSAKHTSDAAIGHILMGAFEEMRFAREPLNNAPAVCVHDSGLMVRFMELLNRYGSTQRYVPFYAERMHLSPNYLNSSIKHLSGMTVFEWVARATVIEAKVLLAQSRLRIQEIAGKLNFPESTSFVRYFRRLTGMTPGQYRKSVNVTP